MEKFKADVVEALIGHVSRETAFLVKDYPYGFRLRCQKRYWLEFKKGKGFRLVTETTNPTYRGEGIAWNKPKASTYTELIAFMYLDSVGHVQWHGLSMYNDAAEVIEFREQYEKFINPEWLPILDRWITLKVSFEAKQKEKIADITARLAERGETPSIGQSFEATKQAARETIIENIQPLIDEVKANA